MSIPGFEQRVLRIPELDQFDQRADNVHDAYAREADSIVGDRDLNPDARHRKLSESTDHHRGQLRKLFAERTAKRDAIKTEKMRDLFGYILTPSPAEQMNRRDADERAAKIESDADALDALERAELSGDTVLARSLALAALTRGWPAVLRRYRESHPVAAANLDVLAAIEDETASGLYAMRYSLIERRI